MKRDKSKIVRWWWWKKGRKRWRNKGLKRWLRVSGVSEVAHSLVLRSQKKELIFFFFLADCRLFKYQFVLTAGVVTASYDWQGTSSPQTFIHTYIHISVYTQTHWYYTYSPYIFLLTLPLSLTVYLKHTSTCTNYNHTKILQRTEFKYESCLSQSLSASVKHPARCGRKSYFFQDILSCSRNLQHLKWIWSRVFRP